jgi:hypothetical protein
MRIYTYPASPVSMDAALASRVPREINDLKPVVGVWMLLGRAFREKEEVPFHAVPFSPFLHIATPVFGMFRLVHRIDP